MIVLVALAVLWISYEVANRLRDTVEGTESARPTTVLSDAAPDRERITRTVTWSALDDHQLTRLLIDSASPSTTDTHDDVAGH